MSWWKKVTDVLTFNPKLKADEEFLKKISFLKSLTNTQIIMFSKFIHKRSFKAGEFIFKEDYPQVVLYFIKQGEIELLPHRHSKQPLMVLSKYQYVGIEELFLGTKRWSSAVAKTDCELLAISKYDFKSFIKRDPRAGIKILYGLCISFSRFIMHQLKESEPEQEDEIS
ncbi:MAG TPA: cyclic nucleotide-binding domain-containing protein [Candidatus Cloacimonadota bacterium]|nr:cyclic nucleotide-binding domain-containing protein [Candidatus Cloacimonadota bacterium]HPT72350.1 cyclic nucleotide-binding domain-containing protein [Candidatus Cloacimonadota bacterium]